MQRSTPYARPRPGVRRMIRGRLYDVVSTVTRVGVGAMFAEYGLALRGRGPLVAERLSEWGVPAAALVAALLPAVLVALSISFAVGLLTWLAGPLLAAAAVVGALTAGTQEAAPFGSWAATALVTAVCVLMAVGGGRWSWDYLVLAPRVPPSAPPPRRNPGAAPGSDRADSARRPEHAPPLLYPVGEAALRRPFRL
ncbi:DoxX family protein [Nocardiopsis aegyptia]|uniref:DoxX family protein n=1 Tax=Nocardiopsis aegyptia TaxID=220378 RepID=UPI00366E40AA